MKCSGGIGVTTSQARVAVAIRPQYSWRLDHSLTLKSRRVRPARAGTFSHVRSDERVGRHGGDSWGQSGKDEDRRANDDAGGEHAPIDVLPSDAGLIARGVRLVVLEDHAAWLLTRLCCLGPEQTIPLSQGE